jgi:hypothetical protein
MRKVLWSTILACLIAGGLGVHFARQAHNEHTVVVRPGSAEEEQEAPPTAFVPLPGSMPSVERLLEAMEIIEPIVVEGTPPEPPPAPEFGGVTLPGQPGRVLVLGPAPPRPEECQPMPYAADVRSEEWLVSQLWHAATRLLTGGDRAGPSRPSETEEPPIAQEQSQLPPVVDYHYRSQK